MDADFDMETLLEYGHPLACEAEALIEGDGIEAQDHSIVYLTTYHKNLKKENPDELAEEDMEPEQNICDTNSFNDSRFGG